ncbi:hypothetical protein AKO1_011850 [Acrasis kona]|uniref:TLC domain-containing protein n=1 Tax=Acrasis kona TaxID=1008807 RepID=A0AAW2Z827_9EUKA
MNSHQQKIDIFAEPGPSVGRIINFWPEFDIGVILLSAAILLALRRFLEAFIFKPIGQKYGVESDKQQRFRENAWFSVYYICMSIFGVFVLWNAEWLWDYRHIVYNYPQEHQRDFERGDLSCLRIYYLVACGFYTQALFGLLFIDERMKDFAEMIAHHFITITLIVFSISTTFHRWGSIIILLHDVVDVFLYSAKCAHELKIQSVANGSFFIFTVSFFVLRLVCLPFLVINVFSSVIFDEPIFSQFPNAFYLFKHVTDAYYPFEVSSYGLCAFQKCVSTPYFLLGFLVLLVCLHIYWFGIVVKLLIKTLSNAGNVPHDPRHMEFNDEEIEKSVDKSEKLVSQEGQTATPSKKTNHKEVKEQAARPTDAGKKM